MAGVTVYTRPPATLKGPFVPATVFTGWEEVSVSRRIDSLSGSFTMKVAADEERLIEPGHRVIIDYGGEPVLTGNIDSIEMSDEEGGSSTTYTGRDKAADLVDCSAVLAQHEFRDRWIDEIIEVIAKVYELRVEVDPFVHQLGPRIALFRIDAGETSWRAMERLCRMRGALAYSLGDGTIRLAAPTGSMLSMSAATDGIVPAHADVELEHGVNVSSMQISATLEDRFSIYIVRGQGQNTGSDLAFGVAASQIEGRALDPQVPRNRQLVVMAEQVVSPADAEDRAQWEATFRAARAATVRVKVPEWQQTPGGRIWQVNELARVRNARRRLDSELLLAGVEFHASSAEGGGESTSLEYVRKDAYRREPEVDQENDPLHDLLGLDEDDDE